MNYCTVSIRSIPSLRTVARSAFVFFLSLLVYQTGFTAVVLREGGPNDYNDASTSRRFQQVLNSVEKLHLYKAIVHFQENQIGEACREIDFTLRWFPNHPRGLQFVTELYEKHFCPTGKTAEDYYSSALRFRPDDPVVHVLYGIHLHKAGSLDKAAEQYNTALSLSYKSSDLHYNLGLLYIKQKQYDKALEHAEKAYEIGHPLPGLKNKLKRLGVWPKSTPQN